MSEYLSVSIIKDMIESAEVRDFCFSNPIYHYDSDQWYFKDAKTGWWHFYLPNGNRSESYQTLEEAQAMSLLLVSENRRSL